MSDGLYALYPHTVMYTVQTASPSKILKGRLIFIATWQEYCRALGILLCAKVLARLW